jgi:hypothetical protein
MPVVDVAAYPMGEVQVQAKLMSGRTRATHRRVNPPVGMFDAIM